MHLKSFTSHLRSIRLQNEFDITGVDHPIQEDCASDFPLASSLDFSTYFHATVVTDMKSRFFSSSNSQLRTVKMYLQEVKFTPQTDKCFCIHIWSS